MLTFTTPLFKSAILKNAVFDKSIILPSVKGPLSLIVTVISLLFSLFVTLTTAPKGNVLCAAVSLFWLNTSPEAVILPSNMSA